VNRASIDAKPAAPEKVWCELRKAWMWAEISNAEFIERAEQIGVGRVASELVAEDATTP